MTAELATIQPNQIETPTQPSVNIMSLVQWAQEAQAAYNLAENLARTPFAGSWKGDIYGATAAILKGAEVGLTPVTSLGAFDNIQGTPAPKAITLRALVQAHGHDLEIIEESDTRAVARYRRNGQGEWRTTEFTIEHARKMNLTGKDNWQKQPGNMLVARVTSKAARLVASDVILGIGYSAEEVRDETAWDGQRISVEQTAPAADRMAAMLGTQTSGAEAAPGREAVAAVPVEPETDSAPESDPITSAQLTKVGILCGELGLTDPAEARREVGAVIGREIKSRKDLTKAEAHRVIEHFTSLTENPFPESVDGELVEDGA